MSSSASRPLAPSHTQSTDQQSKAGKQSDTHKQSKTGTPPRRKISHAVKMAGAGTSKVNLNNAGFIPQTDYTCTASPVGKFAEPLAIAGVFVTVAGLIAAVPRLTLGWGIDVIPEIMELMTVDMDALAPFLNMKSVEHLLPKSPDQIKEYIDSLDTESLSNLLESSGITKQQLESLKVLSDQEYMQMENNTPTLTPEGWQKLSQSFDIDPSTLKQYVEPKLTSVHHLQEEDATFNTTMKQPIEPKPTSIHHIPKESTLHTTRETIELEPAESASQNSSQQGITTSGSIVIVCIIIVLGWRFIVWNKNRI